MKIRRATLEDMDALQEVYIYARRFMAETGNPNQWGDSYPSAELLISDISKGELYIMEEKQANGVQPCICGAFAFPIGEDPTYQHIEGGAWLNDHPYGTIHRIAGNGTVSGLLQKAVNFGLTLVDTIRIDTHEDNKVMQHLIEKAGFNYCGIIYAADGFPRLAYQMG